MFFMDKLNIVEYIYIYETIYTHTSKINGISRNKRKYLFLAEYAYSNVYKMPPK